jgi:DNA helicase-2/ATP-dependent DNA helicase PcrA
LTKQAAAAGSPSVGTTSIVSVHPSILRAFPELNDAQRQAIASTHGPVLIIAGPGAGKTLVLVLRTLNILLHGLAQPGELVVCTYTEKAALELRDRIAAAARKVGYAEDLSELRVGTIHGICNDFVQRHRHRLGLGNNFEVLDDLTPLLFIFDRFDEIIGPPQDGSYLGRWRC